MNMKKLRNVLSLLLACLMLVSGFNVMAYAAKIGDVVDYALYTDIVAYVNDAPIESYNIQGNTAIVAEDLALYGFKVSWDSVKRTLSIALSSSSKFAPTYKVPAKSTHKNGDRALPVLYTDIKTYLNGKEIKSYNINGKMIIYFDDLASVYGSSYKWDPDNRTLKMTTASGNKDSNSGNSNPTQNQTSKYTVGNMIQMTDYDMKHLYDVKYNGQYIYCLLDTGTLYVFDIMGNGDTDKTWDISGVQVLDSDGNVYSEYTDITAACMFISTVDNSIYVAAKYSEISSNAKTHSILLNLTNEDFYYIADLEDVKSGAMAYYPTNTATPVVYATGLGSGKSQLVTEDNFLNMNISLAAFSDPDNLVFEYDNYFFYFDPSDKTVYNIESMTSQKATKYAQIDDSDAVDFAVYSGMVVCRDSDGSVKYYSCDGELQLEISYDEMTSSTQKFVSSDYMYFGTSIKGCPIWLDTTSKVFVLLVKM